MRVLIELSCDEDGNELSANVSIETDDMKKAVAAISLLTSGELNLLMVRALSRYPSATEWFASAQNMFSTAVPRPHEVFRYGD